MKKHIILFLNLVFFQHSYGQTIRKEKDIQLEKTVKEFMLSYNTNNSEGINKLINKDIGLFIFYYNYYYINTKHLQEIVMTGDGKDHENKTNIDTIIYGLTSDDFEDFKGYNFQYKKGFHFTSCIDNESINEGIFIIEKDKYLIELFKRKLRTDKEEGFAISEADKKLKRILTEISPNSRRIIYVSDKEYEKYIFSFYMTYINNNWYLSAIDFTPLVCSA